MTTHPKRETNVEFVTRVMEYSPHGALSQAFIIEAIGRYAKQCAETRIPEGGLVSPDAWQAVAQWIDAEFRAKYGRTVTDMNPREKYVAQILRRYVDGEDNAYEAYKKVYGRTHEQEPGETDMQYIVRCAEQDYADGFHDAAVYQDVFNEIQQAKD